MKTFHFWLAMTACLFGGCAVNSRNLSWNEKCDLRATATLRIDRAIWKKLQTTNDYWEDAEFRMYQQSDIDGDGVDDAVLVTTFERVQENVSFQELFVCLSSSPQKVMQLEVGSKWDRIAEKLTVRDHKIVIYGEKYRESDAGCCPSQPYESTFIVSGGKIVKQK